MVLKASQARQQEHVHSTQIATPYLGTPETCPYKVGDFYEGSAIIDTGFTENVYGKAYHLVIERDKTHLRTKFVFDHNHDLKFSKPVEKMSAGQPKESDIKKYLQQADLNTTK